LNNMEQGTIRYLSDTSEKKMNEGSGQFPYDYVGGRAEIDPVVLPSLTLPPPVIFPMVRFPILALSAI
jgi:hypothetical protein